MEDVVRESKCAQDFCLEHGTSQRSAKLMGLFVEEMAADVLLRTEENKKDGIRKKAPVRIDYRMFVDKESGNICFSMMDLCEHFDPTLFYSVQQDEDSEKYIGIRMVMNMAKEIRYFNTFNSNNIIIYLDDTEETKRVEKHTAC